MTLQQQLARQATRTIANKSIRKVAKNTPIHPMAKKVGVAALIAAVSYLINKKV